VPLSFAGIASLQAHEAFSFVEPYGLRFHAAVHRAEDWERVRPEFEKRFRIRRIRPSLEDVFIRAVEQRT
jgi:hypothetical protein